MRNPIETLESRLFLSATVADGVLTVEGTAAADNVRVFSRRGTINVQEARGTAPTPFPAADVRQIVIRGGDGDDRIRVDRLSLPTLIEGGAGSDRIVGGFGNDRLFGGDGNDRLQARAGDDEVRGQGGNDILDGGSGRDIADFDLDRLQNIESLPDIPPELLTPELLVTGLPLSGFPGDDSGGGQPAGFSSNVPFETGGGGGGGGAAAIDTTADTRPPGAGSTAAGDLVASPLDADLAALASPTTATAGSVRQDVLGGSITRPTSPNASVLGTNSPIAAAGTGTSFAATGQSAALTNLTSFG